MTYLGWEGDLWEGGLPWEGVCLGGRKDMNHTTLNAYFKYIFGHSWYKG